MYSEVKEVKTKGKTVGSVEVTIYETVEELIDSVDEKTILAMFNKANIIAVQAKERQAHAPSAIGKNKKFTLCMNKLTAEEMADCAGDFAALEAKAWGKLSEVEDDLASAVA